MYIPTIFLGTNGNCLSTTVSTINGGGTYTTGEFISSSLVWKFHKFEMSNLTSSALTSYTASLTIASGSTRNANILIVGGGGSGTGTGSFTDGSQTYQVGSAAGGGGGGVVYYNNFPLSPGEYEIGVGAAVPPGTTTFLTGSKGNDSYFKNKTFAYPPFSTAFITAYGGGSGNIRGVVNGLNGTYRYLFGQDGGSGGGSSMTFKNQTFPAYQAELSGTLGQPNFGGLTNGAQGYNGGNFNGGDQNQGVNYDYGTGGGGAGGRGVDAGVGSPSVSTKGTNGGAGITINISGSSVVISGGGAGAGSDKFVGGNVTIGSRGSTLYGAGGNGNLGANTTALQRTTIGNAGLVYIEYPICYTQNTNCTTYKATAGPSIGATITYVPCGSGLLVSQSIGASTSQSFCTYPVGGYPTISGAGSSLITTGSCTLQSNISGSTVCPSGSFISSSYTYTFTNSTATIPGAPAIRVTGFCSYYDNDGVYQSFYNYYYQPLTRTFCARATPAPSPSGGTVSQGGVCAQYCTGLTAPCNQWNYQWTSNNNDTITYQNCSGSVVYITPSTPGWTGSGSFCAQGTPFSTIGFVAFTEIGLVNMAKQPTLKDIAQQFQSLAKIAIQRPPNRAVDTGALRDSIKVRQTRTNKAGGAIFDLDTLYYGVFVENGTRKMKARPFAAEAANSDQFKSMVDDYMKSIVQVTLMEGVKETDKRLKKYTTKP